MYKVLIKFLVQSKCYIYIINIIRKINKGFHMEVAAEMIPEG